MRVAKHLKRETGPIIEILSDASLEDASSEDLADLILDRIKEVQREALKNAAKKPLYAIVARVSFDCGASWQFYIAGPYSTRSEARTKGESMCVASGGEVRWMIFEMVQDPRAFLKNEREVRRPTKWSSVRQDWVGEVQSSAIRLTTWMEPEG